MVAGPIDTAPAGSAQAPPAPVQQAADAGAALAGAQALLENAALAGINSGYGAAHDVAEALLEAVRGAYLEARDVLALCGQRLDAAVSAAVASAYETAALTGIPVPTEDEIGAILAPLVSATPCPPAVPTAMPTLPMMALPPSPSPFAPVSPAAVAPADASPVALSGSAAAQALTPGLGLGPCADTQLGPPRSDGSIDLGAAGGGYPEGTLGWTTATAAGYPAALLARAPAPDAGAYVYALPGTVGALQATVGPLCWVCTGQPGTQALILTSGPTCASLPPPSPPQGPVIDAPIPPTGLQGDGAGAGSCPAPVINCPTPVVNVSVAAPTVNVTVTGPPSEPTTSGAGAGGDASPVAGDGTPPSLLPPDVQMEGTGAGGALKGGARLIGPDWSDPKVCEGIDATLARFGPLPTDQGITGFLSSLVGRTADGWHEVLAGNLTGIGEAVYAPIISVISTGLAWLGRTIGSDLTPAGCTSPAIITPILARAGVALVQRWLDLGLEDVRQQFTYHANYICPTYIPSAFEAHGAYLSNTISQDLWRCWVRANNQYEDPAMLVVEGRRVRPAVHQINALHRRGLITDEEWARRLRGEGVLHPSEGALIDRADDVWPAAQQVFAVAGRRPWDAYVQERYGYTAGQKDLLREEGARLLGGANLDPNWSGPSWVAHWSIPSYREGIEMYLKLSQLPDEHPARMTVDDLHHLAEVERIPPFWEKRILAASQKLLSHRQMGTLHYYGILTDESFLAALQDFGFPISTAQHLLVQWKAQRRDRWAASHWGKLYQSGAISSADLTKIWDSTGMQKDVQADLRDYMLNVQKAEMRKKCIAETAKRFQVGDSSQIDAQTRLVNYGVDLPQAINLVSEWQCELLAKSKTIGASELCQWADDGLITPAQHRARLMQLGYSKDDANRIVALCGARQAAKLAKASHQAAVAEARAQAAQAKATAAAETAMGRVTSAAQRALAKAERQAELRAVRARKLVARAVNNLGLDVATGTAEVLAEIEQLRQAGGLSQDEALAVLEQVVAQSKASKVDDWRPKLAEAAEELVRLRAAQATAKVPGPI